ncbi:MAG: hypothetical protein EA424_22405 [Planctomycetaceae bacterium]|nr:MAG: hypothetical protein EA424_22405 [Planctomycetaceae bacterium]
MPEHFNPYHQWLGLGPLVRSPDASQLLGVKPGETDVDKIRRAAEQAQQRVRSYAPGPRVADWSRLLAEIESAKDALIVGAAGTVGGTTASSGAGTYRRPAPRPRSSAGPASNAAGASQNQANAAPRVPVKAPSQPSTPPTVPRPTAQTAPSTYPAASSLRTRSASKARRSRKSNPTIILACGLGTLMLITGIFLPLFIAMRTRSSDRSVPPHVAEAPAVTSPSTRPSAVPSATRPGRPERARSADEPTPDRSVPAASGLDSSDEQPNGEASLPSVSIEPIELVPASEADPPAAPSVPLGSRGQPTGQQIQQLSDALAGAREALEANRHDDALAQLAGIQDLPMREDDFQRYQRLQLLVQYSRNFREELAQAIAELQGGDEIPVGTNSVVGVVEADRDWVTVRVAGANRTYRLDALPAGLAIAIADLRLADSDPVSLVVKAAYLASRDDVRDDQRQKARDWFREAKQQGVDIGDLEKVLDDR